MLTFSFSGDDEFLESGDEEEENEVEFVMGGASAAPAPGKAAPNSHHRTLLREGGEHNAPAAIAMQRVVVEDTKPSHYEVDIDALETKPWRNEGAKMSGTVLLLV